MKIRHFDTIEQEREYNAKKRLRRNNVIALIIILPVLALSVSAYANSKRNDYTDLFKAIKNGELFEPDFLILFAIMAAITGSFCFLFRKKESRKAKLFSGAATAAVGIIMICMLIIMCIKAI